jgi:hypothetical protein
MPNMGIIMPELGLALKQNREAGDADEAANRNTVA